MIVTEEDIIAAAGTDPRELHARLAAGQPETAVELSRAFEEAGRTSSAAYLRGTRAHAGIGESYTNNGAAVLDVTAQNDQANRHLGNAGQDLEDAAQLRRRAVPALEGAQQTGQRAVIGMHTSLRDLLAQWDRFVQANAAVGAGVNPADQERLMTQGIGVVNAATTTVQRAIDEFDAGLRRDAAELRGRGYTEDPTVLATHLTAVPDPDGATLRAGASEVIDRVQDTLTALGVPIGVAAAALAVGKGVGLVGKAAALSRLLSAATRAAEDPPGVAQPARRRAGTGVLQDRLPQGRRARRTGSAGHGAARVAGVPGSPGWPATWPCP
jgi:hypothetical protein